jgi:hypothetical protein
MPRNDSAFATVVDKATAKTFRDGSFLQAHKKWFDPIGMPLNPPLEAAIKPRLGRRGDVPQFVTRSRRV